MVTKSQMPALTVRGTTFVLTGPMWNVRSDIERRIVDQGGEVVKTMKRGVVLVVASSMLRRDDAGKWEPHGRITRKVEKAIELGSLVYHERTLEQALTGATVHQLFTTECAPQAAVAIPQWSDDMMARMRETSELLASF